MARQDLGKLTRRAVPTPAPAEPVEPTVDQAPPTEPVPAAAVEPAAAPAKKQAPRKQPTRTTRAEDEDGGEGEERETATKGVPVHLPVPLNDRLQAYMAKTRKSHQTVLLDAVSATYKRLPELIRQATAANRSAKKRSSNKKEKPRKLTMAEAKELETLEDKAMEADDVVTTLQEKLSSPDIQTDFEQIPVIMAELEAAKKVADELINRWEFLEEVKANSPMK